MRDRVMLANARRAAALQAARESAARAELADAAHQTRTLIEEATRANASHIERIGQWRDAILSARLDITRIAAHGHAVEVAHQACTRADTVRDTARDQEAARAAFLSLAIARRQLSDTHAKRLGRRLAKRRSERALAELEALTLSRWSKL